MEPRGIRTTAPFWLRGLIAAAVLFLAVRILGNVTDVLTRIAEGGKPPPALVSGPGR